MQGFDYSVLTYWRSRLRNSDRPERIFEAVRAVIEATGVLKGKTRRALDSTLLDDAVATQDTVTQLIAAIRRVRRVVPESTRGRPRGPRLRQRRASPSSPGTTRWREASSCTRWSATPCVCSTRATRSSDPEGASALGLLALVAGQDVELDDEGRWRIVRGVAKDRVISVVDPEARHMHKSRTEYRDGYKAHVAVEPETGLITAAALTPASTPDGPTGVELLEGEAPGLQVLADGAYGSGDTLAALGDAGHHRAIKPHPDFTAVPGGFSRDDFVVDEAAGTATCPAGHVVTITADGERRVRRALRELPAPFDAAPTRKSGRTLTLTVHDAELVESRRAWRDGDFISDYRKYRPMVERSIAWLVSDHSPAGQIPRRRKEPTRPLDPRRRHQPATSDQSRARQRRRLEARHHLTEQRKSRPSRKGPLHGHLPTRVADFDPLHVGASVQTCPGLAIPNIRLERTLFNSLLARGSGQASLGVGVEGALLVVAHRARLVGQDARESSRAPRRRRAGGG